MRAARPTRLALLAALAAAPACLSSPDGKPQTWPPPGLDDLEVLAVTGGDVDDDAIDDLVVVATSGGEGLVFLLRGGVDVRPGEDAPLASFTRVTSLGAVDAPARVIVTDLDADAAGADVIVAHAGSDGPRLVVLDGALAAVATLAVPLPPGPASDVMTLTRMRFGPDDRVFVSVGGQIRHVGVVELTGAAPALVDLPAPGDASSPVTAIAAAPPAATDPRIVVARDTGAWVAGVPATPGELTWTELRDDPSQVWDPPAVADLGGGAWGMVARAPEGTSPDLLCAVRLDGGGTPACAPMGGDRPGRGWVAVGELAGPPGVDVLTVIGGGMAAVAVYPQLDLGATLELGQPFTPSPAPQLPSALAAVGAFGGAAAPDLVLIGVDGAAACLSLGGGLREPCAP
jgi:hypothetical protein